METDRDQPHARKWVPLALGAVLAIDGVLAFGLGGPAWLAVLYTALGAALAVIWIRPARRGAAADSAGASSEPRRALGYVCIGGRLDVAELAAQSETIRAWCGERGLALPTIVHDAGDASRPSLRWALEQIAAGQVQTLVVARLRDVAGTVANLSPLMRWFTEPGRALIAIDLGIDTSTEAGRLAALAVDGVGRWERERTAAQPPPAPDPERSRAGGQGRTAVADVPELLDRIVRMREQGMTLQAIADRLNEQRVPTLRGGAMWRPSSVQRATGYRRPSSQARGIQVRKGGVNGRPPNA